MANSKVVLGDEVLIDLTSDTVESAADIAEGKYGHLKDGTRVCGTHRGGTSGGAYNVTSIDNGDGTQDIHITDAEGAPVYISKSISSNGTYNPSDDSADAYSSVVVNVPTGSAKSASDVTVSGATVTVPAGLYSSQVQKSVASGNAGTPTASKGTVNNHSVTITPSVNNTTGYITGGTKTGTGVTVTASELVSGSETKTENGTYDVTNLSELVVNVSSGGSSMNVQGYHGLAEVASSSLKASGVRLTVAKTGTYKVSWMGARNNTSNTWQTQLYINGTAYGSAQTSFTRSYAQSVVLNGVQLTAGQTVEVYARSRSTSYYMMVGNLIIEQTA